jgi:uncharacterized surface protein with fasciclin (FAS1) repeats
MRFSKSVVNAMLVVVVGMGSATALADDSVQESTATRPAFTEIVRVHGTIVDVAVGSPKFTTLVAALQAADLVTTLQGAGPFTVFAPTNDAFAKVPAPLLDYLLANPQALSAVLKYHVTPGVKDIRFQFDTRDIKTVQGQEVYAEREANRLNVNNTRVMGKEIRTDNGIIYVIDSVLLPQYR